MLRFSQQDLSERQTELLNQYIQFGVRIADREATLSEASATQVNALYDQFTKLIIETENFNLRASLRYIEAQMYDPSQIEISEKLRIKLIQAAGYGDQPPPAHMVVTDPVLAIYQQIIRQRLEREQRERLEQQRQELERQARIRQELERQERERQQRERERQERERQERERQERERAERLRQERDAQARAEFERDRPQIVEQNRQEIQRLSSFADEASRSLEELRAINLEEVSQEELSQLRERSARISNRAERENQQIRYLRTYEHTLQVGDYNYESREFQLDELRDEVFAVNQRLYTIENQARQIQQQLEEVYQEKYAPRRRYAYA